MARFSLVPRKGQFFELFEQSARNVVKAAMTLKDLVDNWESVDSKVSEIVDLEHEGDSITHEIMAQLNRTFVTPFDREDITQLANSLDDVVDFIHASARAMLNYRIENSTERAKELADIIVQASMEVERAIPKLRHRAELRKITSACVEINRLENVADDIYRSAMAELFDKGTDIAKIIKWREIYEHMESATDRCEDVSNVLEGVALKYA